MANFNRNERFNAPGGRDRSEGGYNRDRDFRRQRGDLPDWDRYGSYRDIGRSGLHPGPRSRVVLRCGLREREGRSHGCTSVAVALVAPTEPHGPRGS